MIESILYVSIKCIPKSLSQNNSCTVFSIGLNVFHNVSQNVPPYNHFSSLHTCNQYLNPECLPSFMTHSSHNICINSQGKKEESIQPIKSEHYSRTPPRNMGLFTQIPRTKTKISAIANMYINSTVYPKIILYHLPVTIS